MIEYVPDLIEDEECKYVYDNEAQIDMAIQRIKDNQAEKARLQKLFEERVDQLRLELETKLNKLDRKIEWDLYNVGQVVKNATDKRETKTAWKKQYLSGDVIIKKSKTQLVKPALEEKIITEQFADYAKPKVELKWKELKEHCEIKGDKVINTVTGEDLTKYIGIEVVPEKVEIK